VDVAIGMFTGNAMKPLMTSSGHALSDGIDSLFLRLLSTGCDCRRFCIDGLGKFVNTLFLSPKFKE